MFAVVVRPKSKEISVPSAGLIWRPVEDGRISLQFPPGCFPNDTTNCTVKVGIFPPDLSLVHLHCLSGIHTYIYIFIFTHISMYVCIYM